MLAKRALFLLILLATIGASRSSWAQTTLKGQVSDSPGALIPGIPLHLARVRGSYTQQAVSDKAGQFRIVDVPPGRYTLTVEAQDGFAAFSTLIQVGTSAPPPIMVELAV